MGFLGGAIRSFSGAPGVSVVRKVKNKDLQDQIDQVMGDFSAERSSGRSAFADYLSKYLANAKDSSDWSAQETGSVNDFYNGNVSNRLASLRASRAKAVADATDVAGSQAIRNSSESRLASEGGASSYDTRVLAGALAPIRAQAAMDNANQERSDYGYLNDAQLNLIGRRNQIANAQAAFKLVPENVRRSMTSQDIGTLGGLTQLDNANHFYGLQQNPNQWADFFDAADQGILNGVSIASSLGGAGMSRGGTVKGPGDETSDSIPVRLSKGEYVEPAEACEIPGVPEILAGIRKMALARRSMKNGKSAPDGYSRGGRVMRYAEGGEVEDRPRMGRLSRMPRVNRLEDIVAHYRNPRAVQHFAFGGMVDGIDAVPAWGSGESMWGNMVPPTPSYAAQTPVAGYNDFPAAQSQSSKAAPKKSSGGGGLSAQAVALQARIDKDLSTQWMPSNLGMPQMDNSDILDSVFKTVFS